MGAFLCIAKPLLPALASTGLGIVAFAVASGAGFSLELSLSAALALAGAVNIYALASLNGEGFLLTSQGALGEL